MRGILLMRISPKHFKQRLALLKLVLPYRSAMTSCPCSATRRSRLCLGRFVSPDAREGGLDLLLEAGDQFAVGGDQRLLGFDLGDDGLLSGEGGREFLPRLRLRIGSGGCAAPETIASRCALKFSDWKKWKR